MTKIHPYLCITLCLILTACDSSTQGKNQDANSRPDTDQVLITYQASVDNAGNCRPEKVTDVLATEDSQINIYMLHGSHRYANAEGYVFTSIPLQEKMGSDSTVIMNEALPCSQISVELDISHCVYNGQDRKKMQCPDIRISGENGFKAIKLVRNDQDLLFPET